MSALRKRQSPLLPRRKLGELGGLGARLEKTQVLLGREAFGGAEDVQREVEDVVMLLPLPHYAAEVVVDAFQEELGRLPEVVALIQAEYGSPLLLHLG